MTEEEKLRPIFYFVDAGTPTLKEWAHIESNYYVIYVVGYLYSNFAVNMNFFLLNEWLNCTFQLPASFSNITFATKAFRGRRSETNFGNAKITKMT